MSSLVVNAADAIDGIKVLKVSGLHVPGLVEEGSAVVSHDSQSVVGEVVLGRVIDVSGIEIRVDAMVCGTETFFRAVSQDCWTVVGTLCRVCDFLNGHIAVNADADYAKNTVDNEALKYAHLAFVTAFERDLLEVAAKKPGYAPIF